MNIKFILLALSVFLLAACSTSKPVLEVTTFNTKASTNPAAFRAMDAEVESEFTDKQPGFISRQSGQNEQGEYVVLVFWKSLQDAEASMRKFMTDKSVADYASLIDGPSLKMTRYTVDNTFNSGNSNFVEVMTFDTREEIDEQAFNAVNQQVANDFTAKQKGFLDRITGVDENGKQVVAVYWDTKKSSDAVLQSFMDSPVAKEFMGFMEQSSVWMGRYQSLHSINNTPLQLSNKDKAVALLNSFNTGDQAPIAYINPEKYIQHNLAVGDGLKGFGEIMQHAPPQGFKADVIRAFEDGEYVVTHTKYDFFGPKAGFDVFRFENGLIVEHWDNLLEVQPPNPGGHTQFDGLTEITDLDKTEANKQVATSFVENVLLNHEMDKVTSYINPANYIQHNPAVADGLEGFGAAMKYFAENGLVMEYTKLHKVLGQGNFVLTMSEGKFGKGELTAFYDLFRMEDGLIVEHWDVIAPIAPKAEWKNGNGKF